MKIRSSGKQPRKFVVPTKKGNVNVTVRATTAEEDERINQYIKEIRGAK